MATFLTYAIALIKSEKEKRYGSLNSPTASHLSALFRQLVCHTAFSIDPRDHPHKNESKFK